MMPLRAFLNQVQTQWTSVEVRYIHPSLYLIVVDDRFSLLADQERSTFFFRELRIDENEASRLCAANNIILTLVTTWERSSELDFIDESPSGHHWIEFLATAKSNKAEVVTMGPRLLHFYGYKGGQGRSTVLTMLAKSLADDGYRVLVVDADIEAPSLHSQFGARVDILDATLLGCVQGQVSPVPQQVYVPRNSPGSVDLIACKPSGPEYNLDLAVFTLNTALNPSLLQDGFRRILESAGEYDLVLVDHRSGIGSSVIPMVAAFPGPTIICIRLDEQSDEADEYLRVLLSRNPDSPGLFVSFSLDPEDTSDKLRDRSGARIESLLDLLGSCISTGAEKGEEDEEGEVRADALRPYWISWFLDRSFLAKPTPDIQQILPVNRQALMQIRELTGLEALGKVRTTAIASAGRVLTNSGNTDQGLLIETDALRRLRSPNSGSRYIFGRKGTGKTRLVRALVEEGHGKTLLTAEDVDDGVSISSANPLFTDLAALLFKQNATDRLWWILLDCALESTPSLKLGEWLERIRKEGGDSVLTSAIAERFYKTTDHQVFLIDGVETAFTSGQTPTFIQGLFRFLAVIQSNSQIASKVTIRLFLRTDLVQLAGENVEQQIDGRSLILFWDTQSIFNFALSRIAALDWFRLNFPATIREIDTKMELLAEGKVSTEECGEILLKVFPNKVRRNNLLMLTFLKTYFSEGEGEAASFYPRIYDAFLRSIDDPIVMGVSGTQLEKIDNGRVGQQLIIRAHDYASGQYLSQVAAELRNLISLADDVVLNRTRIDALLASINGLTTPFELKTFLETIHGKLNAEFAIDRDRVKSVLEQMKRVGIFEERPGQHGWWRAGRLFKNSLGMKYQR